MQSFDAIDFETANECPTSVCSVGVVIVREGEMVDKFYSLIHPDPEYYKWFCQQVHGLCEADIPVCDLKFAVVRRFKVERAHFRQR